MPEDLDHALITEQSLTPEQYEADLRVLKRAANPDYLKTADGEFGMVLTSARRSARAYELKMIYERNRTDTAKANFCRWLRDEGFHPE
ncbi:hypothetical protein E4T66_06140 [Sinimarinibacterium sp. CAU 1509]|nr:hypothetical protein E4T66_06140 [Sinimarinibacterium sp. CAU 1509]